MKKTSKQDLLTQIETGLTKAVAEKNPSNISDFLHELAYSARMNKGGISPSRFFQHLQSVPEDLLNLSTLMSVLKNKKFEIPAEILEQVKIVYASVTIPLQSKKVSPAQAVLMKPPEVGLL
jgi:hypothetical protein